MAEIDYRAFSYPASTILFAPDPSFGFLDRKAADFRSVIRLPLEELRNLRQYRVGQLNMVATEHFRESLGQFYRRYPYNEWYPLTKEEAESYAQDKRLEPTDLYEWQRWFVTIPAEWKVLDRLSFRPAPHGRISLRGGLGRQTILSRAPKCAGNQSIVADGRWRSYPLEGVNSPISPHSPHPPAAVAPSPSASPSDKRTYRPPAPARAC